jgi:hypothetical protein
MGADQKKIGEAKTFETQRNGGSGGNRKIRESEEEMSGRKARWSRIEQLASNKKQENRKSTEAGNKNHCYRTITWLKAGTCLGTPWS